MPYAVYLVSATLFGAVIGSYLNSVIYRLPQRDRNFDQRSICPSCGARVPAYLNLPIISWLILLGKTKCCGKPLSIRYPLVEALTALLFFGIAWFCPGGYPTVTDSPMFPIEGTTYFVFVFHGFFLANLIANTFIDIDHRILPDVLTKSLMAVGVAAAVVVPEIIPAMMKFGATVPLVAQSLISSVVGLGAGFGLTWVVRKGARVAFGRDAMGFGDVKLMGGVGAFLGWQGALLTFFVGCLAGAVGGTVSRLATKDPFVAFGPYLALGAVITLFCREPMIFFLTVTWPEWQRANASSPAVLVGIVVVSFILLVVLVRRGRNR